MTFDLAGLPTSITLCRDPTAIQFFSIDEEWGMGIDIDIDNNVSTGAPPFGFDVVFLTHTLTQQSPCTATTANAADSLVVDALAWSADSNSLVPFDSAASVSTDFPARSIMISAGLDGPLSGLIATSNLVVSTAAFYQPTAGAPAVAQDSSSPFTLDTVPATFAANDVQGCNAPCSPSADWYPLIDIIGITAGIVPGDDTFKDGFESPPSAIAD